MEIDKKETRILLELYAAGVAARWTELKKQLIDAGVVSETTLFLKLKSLKEKGLVEKRLVNDKIHWILTPQGEIEASMRKVTQYLDQTTTAWRKIGTELKSVKDTMKPFEKTLEDLRCVMSEVSRFVDEISPITNDITNAVNSGDLQKEILEAPIGEAIKIYLTRKVYKGELPAEILEMPLREAIRKYEEFKRP